MSIPQPPLEVAPALTTPYPDNDAVKAQIELVIPGWQEMDSFNLSTKLRMWSTAHTLHGGPDISTIYMPVNWHGNLYLHLNTYANNQLGVWCSGYAHTYEEILALFGFESYSISVGIFPKYTHAAQLVKVDINGHEKFIIQDPYFEWLYRWNNGTPISWLEMCDEMTDGRYDTFYREDTNVDDREFTFSDIMGRQIFEAPNVELLGDNPTRGIWMYEYAIASNDGMLLDRDDLRGRET